MAEKNPQKSIRTRRAIAQLLKQEGAMDSQELAKRLGVSAMAVRQHLYALQDEQLVTYSEEARAMGRPAKLWKLTPEANRLFPDRYAELTLDFIESVRETFGNEGMEKLLEVRTKKQLGDYQSQISPDCPLKNKLEKLVEIRSNEGYMAQYESLPDGSFLLIENHCPICAAAEAYTGLCDRELEVFQLVLGENIKVERVEHILNGARRCAYQVSNLNQE